MTRLALLTAAALMATLVPSAAETTDPAATPAAAPAAAAPAAAATPSFNLRQRQEVAETEAEIQSEVDVVTRNCGKDIPVTFNWSSFSGDDLDANYSISGYCAAPLQAMRDLCDDSDGLGKAAINEKISAMVCQRGAARSLALGADGVLTYTIDFESANDYDYAMGWFGGNL